MQHLAVIGYPIGHSISPAIYNGTFPSMGIDAQYDAWAVPAEELGEAMARFRKDGMLGASVTVPHKQAVMPLLDSVDPAAAAIGAVNCIVNKDGRLMGHNTDKYGFIRSLREAGFEPAGKAAVLLGAGGSARAVTFGLAEAGVASIGLAGRTLSRLQSMASEMRSSLPGGAEVSELAWGEAAFEAALRAADLIVNCTPVGMQGTPEEQQSPIDSSFFHPGLWVYDLVYRPMETVLLREAKAAGASCVGGLEMLIYQAVQAIELWTGREPPVDIMRSSARKALGLEG